MMFILARSGEAAGLDTEFMLRRHKHAEHVTTSIDWKQDRLEPDRPGFTPARSQDFFTKSARDAV